jgi:hypothetical protein
MRIQIRQPYDPWMPNQQILALTAPPTQNGNWTMTVSANKCATADCIP